MLMAKFWQLNLGAFKNSEFFSKVQPKLNDYTYAGFLSGLIRNHYFVT